MNLTFDKSRAQWALECLQEGRLPTGLSAADYVYVAAAAFTLAEVDPLVLAYHALMARKILAGTYDEAFEPTHTAALFPGDEGPEWIYTSGVKRHGS